MGRASVKYTAGVASVDITPPAGVWLVGYGARDKRSDSVYHCLRAGALAVSDGKTELLIVRADWIGFYSRTALFRAEISKATGVPEKNIMLCGSHTHCGPSIGRPNEIELGWYGEKEENYFKEALEKITVCAARAHEDMEPAELGTGNAVCGIACSRRKPDGGGKVFRQMQPSPGSPCDHDVPVVTITGPGEALKAVLYSYACHPTAGGAITAIGGDYAGFADDRIADRLKAAPLFLQGFGGDQKPLNPNTGTFAHTIEEIKAQGDKLGDSVVNLVESGPLERVEGEIKITQTNLTLKMRVPDDETLMKNLEGGELQREWAEHITALKKSGRNPQTEVYPFEIQTARFNSTLAVAALAGEITAEHGLRLKKTAGPYFKNIITVGYANDIVGYIPARRQIPEGGYEVWAAQQLWKRTGPFEDGTEDLIHEAVEKALGIDQPRRESGSKKQ